jgi:prophage antirepressor-like protein
MNELQVISKSTFLGKEIDVYGTAENPLFLAKDVAEWIEHSDAHKLVEGIDEDEKLTGILFLSGQNREAWFLTEAGLYETLMLSRKPIAKQFKKGVKEILKQIRKTGQYSVGQPSLSDKLQLNLTFADWTIKTLNLNEASKICWAKKIAERFGFPADALPSGVNAGTEAPTLHAAKDLLKANGILLTPVAFNRILVAKGVIHEATRPSRDKNKPWKWKVLNKGFECFGQNIQDPNFQSQTQIKWYDNRFRGLLEFVGIEIPQTLGF